MRSYQLSERLVAALLEFLQEKPYKEVQAIMKVLENEIRGQQEQPEAQLEAPAKESKRGRKSKASS